MSRRLIGCIVVVCFALSLFATKCYVDGYNNVLEHPKGAAGVTIEDVYVYDSAIFLDVHVDDAPFGSVNFNHAAIKDSYGYIKTVDDTLNVSIPQGQQGTLIVNCNCTLYDDYWVCIGDNYNTWSQTID
jgi:hypothetical protein